MLYKKILLLFNFLHPYNKAFLKEPSEEPLKNL